MGKVELAFDHTQNKNDIKELSVVVYTDSFFYGLWDNDQALVKVGYHPYNSLEGVLKLWDYYYSFDQVNLLSAIKPFVHLHEDDVDEIYFEAYFKGLYNLNRISKRIRKIDGLHNQPISTLHYLNHKVTKRFDDHVVDYKATHISTAMANYCQSHSEGLLCYLSNGKLHLTLSNSEGFRFYNQFDCYYDQDYLYYLLLILSEFDLDIQTYMVKIGGDIQRDSELFRLLNKHIKQLQFVDEKIKMTVGSSLAHISDNKSQFYDLYLCKTCV